MTLNTQASPATVLRLLEEGLFTRRNRARFHAQTWTKDEVFLVPWLGSGKVIVTVRGGKVTINAAPGLDWILKEVVKVVRRADPLISILPEAKLTLPRRRVGHAHLRGNCSVTAKAPKKDHIDPQTSYLLSQAINEVESELGGWVVFSDTARKTAAEYRYVDLEVVKSALRALGEAAKINAGGGLGMSWKSFLASREVNYSPNSSKTAKERFKKQYEVVHEGKRVLTEAHVCFGTGKPPFMARIYLRQPDKPGDPVIIGSMGPHLDIPTRH